jgi:hypothetical protein
MKLEIRQGFIFDADHPDNQLPPGTSGIPSPRDRIIVTEHQVVLPRDLARWLARSLTIARDLPRDVRTWLRETREALR